MWCRLGSRVDIDIDVVQRISLPLLVASLLLFSLFDGIPRMVFICMALAALAHQTMFNWYSVSVANKEFRLHPVRGYAQRSVSSWVGFFVGCCIALLCTYILKLQGTSFLLVMVIFAILLVVAFSIYGGNHSATRVRFNVLIDKAGQAVAAAATANVEGALQQGEAVDGGALSYADHCSNVAARYSLTPRETEVFTFLARGRNAEYIANQLVVSPATVKSHIYHIYQKLGVNSQQRLMDLVEDEDKISAQVQILSEYTVKCDSAPL